MVNGFRTRPELESIRVASENVAPFSLPQEALDFVPDANTVFSRFKNGDSQRQIHCNVKLHRAEEEGLRALRAEAAARGASFLPSVATMASRYLCYARGDHKKALTLMQRTQDWRLSYFGDGPVTDESVMEDLRHGFIYFGGRDRSLRPTLVVRASRVPQAWQKERRTDKIIRVLVFCMEYFLRFMVVPGRVESLNVIVDLSGLSISTVPLQQLKEVYAVMSRHYIIRVFRFYICHMPTMLNMLMGVVKSILSERQQQKLVPIRRVTELRQEFALHHLEVDLGGLRPVVTEFFPFPLQAGPFRAGDSAGPSPEAVPGLHEAWLSGILRVLPTPAGAGEAADPVDPADPPLMSNPSICSNSAAPTARRLAHKLSKTGTLVSEQDTEAGSDPYGGSGDCSSQEGDSIGRRLGDMEPDEVVDNPGAEELQSLVVLAGGLLSCGFCQASAGWRSC